MQKNEIQKTEKPESRVKSLLGSSEIKQRFNELLGSKSNAFLSSVLSTVNNSQHLKECDPMSVISAASVAASMDLPINQNLGFSYIVPYKNSAQFQIGWKGIIQLAMRSGQYKTINITKVLKGQVKFYNKFTGEMEFNHDDSVSDLEVEGYLLYFKLLNGYEKFFYMTKSDCEKHGKKYSASFKKGYGLWVDDFDSMALKTVAKLGLSKYGILSVDMQKAIELDQAEIVDDKVIYPDNARDVSNSEEKKQPKKKNVPNNLLSTISENVEKPVDNVEGII